MRYLGKYACSSTTGLQPFPDRHQSGFSEEANPTEADQAIFLKEELELEIDYSLEGCSIRN